MSSPGDAVPAAASIRREAAGDRAAPGEGAPAPSVHPTQPRSLAQARTPQFLMDMSHDAFDDQYEGCTEAMEAVGPALLAQEQARGKSRLFGRVWARAGERWQQVKGSLAARLPPGFKDEYGQAVIAYTDNGLHHFFNAAMRAAGRSRAAYNASFPFKALHFYLTRALQLLRGPCEATYGTPVYRGIAHTHYQLQGASPFRFGSFASSSFRREQAESFGQDTFLSIRSCFGVPIHAFSLYTEEEEVLIPGHEIFWVFPDEGSHRFVLRSTNRTCSHFNCAFLGYEKSPECRGSTVFKPPTNTACPLGAANCRAACWGASLDL
ncbi:ecto-ADP-ribosyltransferase 5-like [Aythya fuligula]|uniref:NAD(P)(+)--arginine ADP-ribosyltransferase n=1 Tax=Aythya fuligula TaxID=219594 RepID=A0A6J3EJ77_AYTFU|nr:ecto-ADP-ribosyltransferase 5-like [Aythya fuligula]